LNKQNLFSDNELFMSYIGARDFYGTAKNAQVPKTLPDTSKLKNPLLSQLFKLSSTGVERKSFGNRNQQDDYQRTLLEMPSTPSYHLCKIATVPLKKIGP